MSVPVFAVSDELADLIRERAEARSAPVQLARIGPEGELLDRVGSPEALLASGNVRPPVLGRLLREHASIRWVAVTSAGVDAWLVPEVTTGRVMMTRARHIHDVPVAEYALGLMLAGAKRLPETFLAQQRTEWVTFQPAMLAGKTLVIVGYGEIGRALAARARAFEMRIIGVRQKPSPDDLTDLVVGTERLEEMLGQADFAVLAVPGGANTRGLIGERQLRALPKQAYLINVGRGEVIDEAALDAALREERFAGALIDTFTTEPLPAGSPLWTNERVVVTPHLAGLRAAPTSSKVVDQVVDNIGRFGRGEALVNQVDIRRGY